MMTIGIIIGSTIGELIAYILGFDLLSVWSLVLNTVGSIIGILVVYKIKNL